MNQKTSLKISRAIPNRIGITGSPATGKKSVGLELANITGRTFVSINEYAIRHGFGRWIGAEFEVNTGRLYGRIDTTNKIVCGHLLSDVVPKDRLDLVIVLRCSPLVLRKRYKKRGYNKVKTIWNLEAELIGDISSNALKVYGIHKLAEIDMTRIRNPRTAAKRIIDIANGMKPRLFGKVDWLSHIHSAGELNRISA